MYFHISAWDLKENIWSVILVWRRRCAGRSSEGEWSTGLSSEGRDTCGSLKQTCHACSPTVALILTKGPSHRRNICANSDCISTSHTSPPKNKNINYLFKYLRVVRNFSSGSICDSIRTILTGKHSKMHFTLSCSSAERVISQLSKVIVSVGLRVDWRTS